MNKFRISSGMKNVSKISFGTLVGQIISVISLPILTRIYGVTIIGDWALFNSIATIISSFSDLGLSNAIMVESDEGNAVTLYRVVSTINLIFSILSFVVVFIFYCVIPNGEYSSSFISLIVAVLVVTLQQTQICYTWINRNEGYNSLMLNPIINNSVIFMIALVLGVLGNIKYGYFIGIIIGQIITLLHMKKSLPKKTFTFELSTITKTIQMHRVFVKYQLSTNVLANFKNQLPTLLINHFFGNKILGFYSISIKILNIPIQLIARAVGRVFFQTTTKMKQEGKDIGEYVFQNIKKASVLALLPMIGLVAVGDILIMIVFGNDYEMAGNMLRIVVFQSFFTFLMMASQGLSITLKKQNYALYSSIAQIFTFVIGIGCGYLYNDIYLGLIISTVGYCIIQIIYFGQLFKKMKISPLRYFKNIFIILSIIIIVSFGIRCIIDILGFSI